MPNFNLPTYQTTSLASLQGIEVRVMKNRFKAQYLALPSYDTPAGYIKISFSINERWFSVSLMSFIIDTVNTTF